jgi:hypothetical protein
MPYVQFAVTGAKYGSIVWAKNEISAKKAFLKKYPNDAIYQAKRITNFLF